MEVNPDKKKAESNKQANVIKQIVFKIARSDTLLRKNYYFYCPADASIELGILFLLSMSHKIHSVSLAGLIR